MEALRFRLVPSIARCDGVVSEPQDVAGFDQVDLHVAVSRPDALCARMSVESSEDLVTWERVDIATPMDGPFDVRQALTGARRRFLRGRWTADGPDRPAVAPIIDGLATNGAS